MTDQSAEHLSAGDRYARGRERRRDMPRAALAELHEHSPRPDPLALLDSQDRTRIAELVPIRYGRMMASPFSFYRGGALIMASDLAAGPHTGIVAQLCGDAHLSNFGLFASPQRDLVFDVNDFDETLPGPWEWDLKRLLASLAIAGRTNGFGSADREKLVLTAASAYRQRIHDLAAVRELDVWYSHTTVDDVLKESTDPLYAKEIRQTATKAMAHDSRQALSKMTQVVDGQRRLVSNPPLLVPIEELVGAEVCEHYETHMDELFDRYRDSLEPDLRTLAQRYRYATMARKVVGVGSVGTRSWVVMLLGRDDDDPLLMQIKEAQPSVLERYLQPSAYPNAAERVFHGQRIMQATGDILLGWLHGVGPDGHESDYYVRQLHDWKGSAVIETMSPQSMADYGRSCAHVLARAHARSGDRLQIAGYLGSSDAADRALAQFAETYADRNDRDYAELCDAVRDKRVTAVSAR